MKDHHSQLGSSLPSYKGVVWGPEKGYTCREMHGLLGQKPGFLLLGRERFFFLHHVDLSCALKLSHLLRGDRKIDLKSNLKVLFGAKPESILESEGQQKWRLQPNGFWDASKFSRTRCTAVFCPQRKGTKPHSTGSRQRHHRGVRARILKPKHLAFMSPSLLQSFITLGKPLNCSTP